MYKANQSFQSIKFHNCSEHKPRTKPLTTKEKNKPTSKDWQESLASMGSEAARQNI